MDSPPRSAKEEVLREWPPIGRYRVRLLRSTRPQSRPTLDIREYISSETFEGFTRRGVRIHDKAGAELLASFLQESLEFLQ